LDTNAGQAGGSTYNGDPQRVNDRRSMRHSGRWNRLMFDLRVERYDRYPPGNWDDPFWTWGYWSFYGGVVN